MKLKLFKPVTPFIITQNFGEDLACVNSEGKVVTRIAGQSCPSGYESLYKKSGMKFHNALDLRAKAWQPVYAACSGWVEEYVSEEARGLGLGIITPQKYDMNQYGEHYAKTRYWHLAAMNVKLGDYVNVGQLIGWANNTGYSSGEHLHFELKAVEKNDNGGYYNVFQLNGLYGAIDPLPFMEQLSAYELNSAFEKIKYQLIDIMNRLQDFLSQ